MSHPRDPIAMLNNEHVFIRKVVDALGRLIPSADQAAKADLATLRMIARFMREFADQCHHAKEEDVLFPAMEQKGVPETGCPLGALRHEHEQGRGLVKALLEAVEAQESGEADAGSRLVGVVRKIEDLYASHIWKEEDMVFPMSDRLFSDTERAELCSRFERAEQRIGTDRARWETFADHLERSV